MGFADIIIIWINTKIIIMKQYIAALAVATTLVLSCEKASDKKTGPTFDWGSTVGYETLAKWEEGYVDIHFINTATGECVFIIMPDGTKMLVDMASEDTQPDDEEKIGGVMQKLYLDRVPNRSIRPSEVINKYIKTCMLWTGKLSLDYVNITHFHGDHIGNRTADNRVDGMGGSSSPSGLNKGGYQKIGAAEILDGNKVLKLIDRAYPDYDYPKSLSSDFSSNKMKNYLNAAEYHEKNSGTKREAFQSGSNTQFKMNYNSSKYPTFEIRNLCSNGKMWTGAGNSAEETFPANSSLTTSSNTSTESPNENMTSSVFKLSYGKFDFFCGGDVVSNSINSNYPWRDVERGLANLTGEVDLLKANHHGSADGNTEYFLSQLAPQAIVVCNWRTVQPRDVTYERLISPSCNNGISDIFFLNDNAEYAAANYSDGGKSVLSKQGHVVVRVAPGGDTFKIYILEDKDTSMSMKIKSEFGPYDSRD